ncbi:MAG: ABC transporter ATP-binding protein [Bacteroidia bacterium]
MLKTEQLAYSYTGGSPLVFPDMECPTGDKMLILGQSGKGKTTLLHLLAGLLTPKAGTIRIADTVLTDLKKSELDRFRGQHIGLIFQRSHFVKALNVGDNLRVASYLAGVSVSEQRIKTLLERLGIDNKIDKPTSSLSQGEQQRVAIARALVNKPSVILADEPTSSLDDQNTEQVIDLLNKEAEAAGASLIIVTHDQRLKDHFTNSVVL